MPERLSLHQTTLLRMISQGLTAPSATGGADPVRALSKVVVTQAQDLPAGILSLRPRGRFLTEEAIDTSIRRDRTIIWTWLHRGTLHLVTKEDLSWLLPLISPVISANHQTRMRQLGWDRELVGKGNAVLAKALQQHGELPVQDVSRLFEQASLPHEGQAVPNFLGEAALQGIVCRGSGRGRKFTYVLLEDWVGKPTPLPLEEALARLARKFLQAYAPAGPRDLAAWTGMSAAQARQAFELISAEIEAVMLESPGDGEPEQAWLLTDQLQQLEKLDRTSPVVRLMPRFETYLLGYRDRGRIIDSRYQTKIYNGGIINPVLLVDGKARGAWKLIKKKARLEVQVETFDPLPASLLPLIESEAQEIGRFYQLEVDWKIAD
jgi:hypothetical protein